MNKIRVLLVDDQALIRDGLKTVLSLEETIEVAGTAGNGFEACRLAELLKPDLILLDIRMPEMDGMTCAGLIRQKCPDIKIIMLTTFNDENYVMESYANQAWGYILKDVGAARLVEAIHDAFQGKITLLPEIAATLSRGLSTISLQKKKEAQCAELGLTEKEKEIAEMLVQGFTNKQIASALYMAEGTVRNYISSLYSRIGLNDRTQAVLYLKGLGF